ncbi:hypothetical protein BXZ70DRAFT_618450 [Cristinia sonorae]|uniref:F-box domain-containing protein n=1 Tax=Cristinia sonorae TaxID=1940300 RepID=A0A8K0XSY5_9AGAR|nr:hypothetical protein BXZ70DRAFT_618450 [Cristinia sonorae]
MHRRLVRSRRRDVEDSDTPSKNSQGVSALWRTAVPAPPSLELDEKHIIKNLKDDLLLARREVFLQRKLIRALKDEIARLKFGQHYKLRVQDTVGATKRTETSWSELDYATLQLIFGFVIPPSAFLDSSLHPGPNSLWCKALRMKKSLTMICKPWRRVALPFLYSEVILRRAGQVIAFSRTLSCAPRNVVPLLVRSVSFSCYVPGNIRSLVSRHAAIILQLCRRVIGLQFSPNFLNHYFRISEDTRTTDDDAFLTALHTTGPRIHALVTHFDDFPSPTHGVDPATACSPHSSMTYSLPFLSTFPNLHSLTLPLSMQTWAEGSLPISFHRLSELNIVLLDATDEQVKSYSMAMATWSLPSLTRVGVRFHYDFFLCSRDPCSGLPPFFEAHGPQIRELDFGPLVSLWGCSNEWCQPESRHNRRDQVASKVIPPLIALCPSLRYLGLPASATNIHDSENDGHIDRIMAVCHPDVQVDLWARDLTSSFYRNFWGSGKESRRNIRLVKRTLSSLPNLPRILSRCGTSEQQMPDTVVHRVYDAHFVEAGSILCRIGDLSKEDLQVLLNRHSLSPEEAEIWESGLLEFDSKERPPYAYQVDSAEDTGHGSQANDTHMNMAEDEEDTADLMPVDTEMLEERMKALAVDRDLPPEPDKVEDSERSTDDDDPEGSDSDESTDDSGSEESDESDEEEDGEDEDVQGKEEDGDESLEANDTDSTTEGTSMMDQDDQEGYGGLEEEIQDITIDSDTGSLPKIRVVAELDELCEEEMLLRYLATNLIPRSIAYALDCV